MKLKESDFAGTLKTGISAILLYGPDNGKTSEFINKVIQHLKTPRDNIVTTNGTSLKDSYDRIFADACSVAMFGGDKLVIIQNPDGRDLSLITDLCESACSPVVISAGELDAQSGLRKYFENHERFSAIPLYADDEKSLGALIRGELSNLGITQIDNDAVSYMCQHLGADRAVARGFIQKIALYVNDTKRVTLEDAEKCLPDAGAANMDDFKYNMTAGNISQTLRAMDRLFMENVPTSMMARIMNTHFKDLMNCVAGGMMPRVFWKYDSLFGVARRIWNESELINVLNRLNRLESDLRGWGDSEVLFRDFALKLSTRAYKLASIKK